MQIERCHPLPLRTIRQRVLVAALVFHDDPLQVVTVPLHKSQVLFNCLTFDICMELVPRITLMNVDPGGNSGNVWGTDCGLISIAQPRTMAHVEFWLGNRLRYANSIHWHDFPLPPD